MSKEMAPLARGELYLGSCGGWLILVPGIPWLNLRLGGWRLPSKELEARFEISEEPRRQPPWLLGCVSAHAEDTPLACAEEAGLVIMPESQYRKHPARDPPCASGLN